MATATKTKTKDTELENITFKVNSQAIGHREIYIHNDLRVKLELQSDSYRKQCFARAYVLNGLEWSLIYSIPPEIMNTEDSLIYRVAYRDNQANAKKEFALDVKTLKDRISELI